MPWWAWALAAYFVIAVLVGVVVAGMELDRSPLSSGLLWGLGWPYTLVKIFL